MIIPVFWQMDQYDQSYLMALSYRFNNFILKISRFKTPKISSPPKISPREEKLASQGP